MDTDLVREKLRLILCLIGEIQAELPDEPPGRPYLVVVKNGEYDIGDDLPDMMKPSRAREGFPILRESGGAEAADETASSADGIIDFPPVAGEAPAAAGAAQTDSMAKTREEALYYSQEEIAKMPKLKDGHFRKTPDGYWQVRYRRGGHDIQFTSKKKTVVMERFREWARSVDDEKAIPKKPLKKRTTFADFAELYFTNVKAVNVKPVTYEMQERCLRRHILPALGAVELSELTPMKCQVFLNKLLLAGLGRTSEEAKILLKEILRAAVGERLIDRNPMDYVKLPKHQSVHGRALSKVEIADFIERCKRSFYQKQFMLYLYTGIRRSEIASVTFDENFVTVANGKCRKGERQTYRKIPIAPGLRQYLPIAAAELAKCGKVMTNVFKKVFPSHQLYDLRHTFTTRCQESGIAKELVDVWTGHVNRSDMTTAVYTHFSDDFMLREIQKLDF